MHIEKVIIENFKCFEWNFSLDLNKELNIIVWDNEVWKTTILEAINLALSWWIYGKYLWVELNQSLFNLKVINNYLHSLTTKDILSLPKIIIELYFEDIEDDSIKALFEWNYNSTKKKACWVRFEIWFSDSELNKKQYEILLQNKENIKSLPIEFYDYSWSTFAREYNVKPKNFNQYFSSTFIDSSNYRYQNGCDTEVLKTIRKYLNEEEKIWVSLAHRQIQDKFSVHDSISPINKKLQEANLSDKSISLAVELTTKSAWEDSLTVYVWDSPFSNSWKWEQCIIKTKLALNNKKSQESNVLLIEEPENHLSHSKLNKLINYISNNHKNKQIVISTHSSFVANKLLLWNLILLNKDNDDKRNKIKIDDLKEEIQGYFEKLSWYDTLRLILCRKAILVEWPSDELIVQRAYKDTKLKLPIEDEVDVISVWTWFLNFLEIAEKMKKPVVVVTDNDWDIDALKNKYSNYLDLNKKENIEVFFDNNIDSWSLTIWKDNKPFNYNTLEPKLLKANSNNITLFNKILWSSYSKINDLHKYMKTMKTESALKIFDTKEKIIFPQYILDAISWEYEQK